MKRVGLQNTGYFLSELVPFSPNGREPKLGALGGCTPTDSECSVPAGPETRLRTMLTPSDSYQQQISVVFSGLLSHFFLFSDPF